MDVNDLWIGDYVMLKKSGRVGKYDGIDRMGKHKVKIGEKIVKTTAKNLEKADEPKIQPKYIELKEEKEIDHSHPTGKKLEESIDLHIEILNPNLLNAQPERIIDFQIKAAKTFIERCIDSGTSRIEIIHGRGEGVLKLEVHHLISLYDEVQFSFEKNRGGSTEIWLHT